MPAPERQAVAKRWGFLRLSAVRDESVGEEEAAKATARGGRRRKGAKRAGESPTRKRAAIATETRRRPRRRPRRWKARRSSPWRCSSRRCAPRRSAARRHLLRSAMEAHQGKSGRLIPTNSSSSPRGSRRSATLGLDATRAAWARSPCSGVLEHQPLPQRDSWARAEILSKAAAALAATDPASFDHCKQLTVSLTNARRLGGATKPPPSPRRRRRRRRPWRFGTGRRGVRRDRAGTHHARRAQRESRREFCEA